MTQTIKPSNYWGTFSLTPVFPSRVRSTVMNDIAEAHRMVETFINAFSRDQYALNFERTHGNKVVAYTDIANKKIYVSPAPLLDTTLTRADMADVLSGMACHEISHTRYGIKTFEECVKEYPNDAPGWQNAHRLGNLLDDIRIERRFSEEYPGFANIFDTTMEWVARKQGTATPISQLDIAVRASRYDNSTDWTPELEVHRAWWKAWAEHWTRTDSVNEHIVGIREGMDYLKHALPNPPSPPKPQGEAMPQPQDASDGKPDEGDSEQGDDSTVGSGEDKDSEGADKADSGSSEGDSNGSNGDAGGGSDVGTGDEEDEATDAGDADVDPNYPQDASEQCNSKIASGLPLKQLNNIHDIQIHIDFLRSAHKLADGSHISVTRRGERSPSVKPLNGALVASVRNALERSRTGIANPEKYYRSGKLDTNRLHHIAYGRTDLFTRTNAPSPGRYRVWLLVDSSGSMQGERTEITTDLAQAIAQAMSGMQTISASVFGWSTDRIEHVWSKGMPINLINFEPEGGTPDADVIEWATGRIRHECVGSEQPVIFMLSDGSGQGRMPDRVAEARKSGIAVYGISVGAEKEWLEKTYGQGNYIYCGDGVEDIPKIAAPLGRLIGKMVLS